MWKENFHKTKLTSPQAKSRGVNLFLWYLKPTFLDISKINSTSAAIQQQRGTCVNHGNILLPDLHWDSLANLRWISYEANLERRSTPDLKFEANSVRKMWNSTKPLSYLTRRTCIHVRHVGQPGHGLVVMRTSNFQALSLEIYPVICHCLRCFIDWPKLEVHKKNKKQFC